MNEIWKCELCGQSVKVVADKFVELPQGYFETANSENIWLEMSVLRFVMQCGKTASCAKGSFQPLKVG